MKRVINTLLICLIVISPAFAAKNANVPKKTLEISGFVFEADSTPAANMIVNVNGPSGEMSRYISKKVKTGKDGNFTLSELYPGKYNISFTDSKNRYCGYEMEDVQAGTDELFVALSQKYTFRLKAIGPDGLPVEGAELNVAGISDISPFFEDSRNERTDSNGVVRVTLRSGSKYEFTLSKNSWLPTSVTIDMSDGEKPDKTQLTLKIKKGGTVKGRVVCKDKKLISNLRVYAGRSGGFMGLPFFMGNNNSMKKLNGDGTFLLKGLPSGLLTISLYIGSDISAEIASKKIYMEENSKPLAVELLVDEMGSLKGRVVDSDGKPLVDSMVFLTDFQNHISPRQTSTNTKGIFSIKYLQPGTYVVYWLFTNKEGLSGTKSSANPIVIKAGETTEVLLGCRDEGSMELVGKVTKNGKPVVGGELSLLPVQKDSASAGTLTQIYANNTKAKIKRDGTYKIDEVTPGEYILSIIPPNEDETQFAPPIFNEIRRIEAQHKTMDIKIDGATLVGTLTAFDGTPLRDAWIVATPSSTDISMRHILARPTKTDESGKYEILNLSVGRYDIMAVSQTRGLITRKNIEISPSHTTFNLQLPKTFNVSGVVKSASGGKVPEAQVFIFPCDTEGETEGLSTGQLESDGTFTIDQPLSAGEYRAFVITDGYSLGAERLKIEDKDVKYNPVIDIAGSVEVALNGPPETLKGRIVRIYDMGEQEIVRSRDEQLDMPSYVNTCVIAPTDSAGKTRIDGLRPGRYTISVKGTGKTVVCDVKRLETSKVSITLTD